MTARMKSEQHPRTVVGTGLVCLDILQSPDQPDRNFSGGTCGNVLAILAYLGWRSYPVARLDSDSAGELVAKDLEHWGVSQNFLRTEPVASTPVIVEKLRLTTAGDPVHSFSFRCPGCRGWLPTYRAVTARSASEQLDRLPKADVFFFDRPSPGALVLAKHAREQGSLVVFEPASAGNPRHFTEAVACSDVVKYSHERLEGLDGLEDVRSGPSLEVMTLGEDGLRFRKRTRAGAMGSWHHLEGISAPVLRDTAGAGDWTTAMLIDRLTEHDCSVSELTIATLTKDLVAAQYAATWSCQFEGARGGMYVTSPEQFREELSGAASLPDVGTLAASDAAGPSEFCPTCG